MGSPYKTVAFQTLGCKLNFTETSTLARDFTSRGYAQVGSNDAADLYVINTCSVTDNANKKARKAVRRALRKSPYAKIAVIGCYAQLNPDEIVQIPGVSIVAGAKEKFNLISQIETNNLNDEPIILNSNIETVEKFIPSYSMGERTRSFLKIQDGCDYNCSYCTIPLARGRSRSSSISKTLSQAIEIGKTDIKEVVLTGVNVGDFGVNRNENLYNLIQEMEKIDGINRYRISSIEPNLITDEIINFIAISNKFLPHFHIPLQSGSDAILKAMRRRYNTKLYADRVQKIKSIMPYACIGVDVIVGFPGESEDHFQQTYDFLDGLDISYLHVFSYSIRKNTEAVLMNNKVPQDIISERSKMLHRLSIVKKRNFWENNIGSVKQVLIENFEEGFLYGHSENYIPVRILGKRNEVNEIIPVKFIQIEDGAMIGERQI
jgi:threonylcarbamoyladenosine tRNA methylthiotransferase MtaB